jgi:hypothetical protein
MYNNKSTNTLARKVHINISTICQSSSLKKKINIFGNYLFLFFSNYRSRKIQGFTSIQQGLLY